MGGSGGTMSLALAIELSIAMPVSWLPLAGDYAAKAENKACASVMPFIGYFTGSVIMYSLGLFISLSSGRDIFEFVAASRFRVPACAVVALSTLTTAFLDLYSAAVSSEQLVKTRNSRLPVLILGLLALAASVFFPVEQYGGFLEAFLTAIGMVFVPVYCVLFLDFLLKEPRFEKKINWTAFAAAVPGMAAYRFFTVKEIGSPTLLALAVTAALYFVIRLARRKTWTA